MVIWIWALSTTPATAIICSSLHSQLRVTGCSNDVNNCIGTQWSNDVFHCYDNNDGKGCVATVTGNWCDVITNPNTGVKYCDIVLGGNAIVQCGNGAPVTCGSIAGQCSGTCPAGSYCRAKVSGPGECICAASNLDCIGGWVEGCRNSACSAPCRDLNSSPSIDCGSEKNCECCCGMAAPEPPTLISPPNGAQITTPSVTLKLQPPSRWGGRLSQHG